MSMRTGKDFDDFVRKDSAGLLRTAYALVGDYGHAEDLLQTALLRTARRWTAARDAPEAYARRVLVNLCRDRARGLRRRPRESGISAGTVKSYTSRALSSLRATLFDLAAAVGGTPEVFHAY